MKVMISNVERVMPHVVYKSTLSGGNSWVVKVLKRVKGGLIKKKVCCHDSFCTKKLSEFHAESNSDSVMSNSGSGSW
jgi:hypothetical protein